MEKGTYSWYHDREGPLIELSEWTNSPNWFPYQPVVEKWMFLRIPIENSNLICCILYAFKALPSYNNIYKEYFNISSFSNRIWRSYCSKDGKDESLMGRERNETCLKYIFSSYTNCPTRERADYLNCDKKEYFCESDLKDIIDGKVSLL